MPACSVLNDIPAQQDSICKVNQFFLESGLYSPKNFH
jgi:hypothetical protein